MRVVAMLCCLGLAAFGLSACQLDQAATTIDTAVQQNLPALCQLTATAHSSFVIIAATGQIKPTVVQSEAAAWAGVEVLCADPSKVNTSTALVTVAQAYAAVVSALHSADKSG